MESNDFLSYLTELPGYQGQITHIEHSSPRLEKFSPLEHSLHGILTLALQINGIRRFYEHQAKAIDSVMDNHNVIVTSGPSSGKSSIYNIPVLNTFLDDNQSTALYLFPTKALAQDQLRSLDQLTKSLPRRPEIARYDGDTPFEERRELRRSINILITNPEMLHISILPNHNQWERYFRKLKYIVVDEAHYYRGVFGSNIALLLRRLRRICSIYGVSPQFILTSATLGNSKQHGESLIGLDIEVFNNDLPSSGGRDFALWNPPVIDIEFGSRKSALTEGAEVFSELVDSDYKTLTFVRSRQAVELLYRYCRLILESRDEFDLSKIGSYRGGYLKEEREEIEKAFSSGNLIGLVSTNALELGVNFSDLDATILIGYPGSLNSTMQQASRSGRDGRFGLSILILFNNPLEQYIAAHPEILFRRGMEFALIAPDNLNILANHLLCAAYESPLLEKDRAIFGELIFQDLVDQLVIDKKLLQRNRAGRMYWHLSPIVGYPSEGVHLRSTGGDQFTMAEETSGRVLEMIGLDDILNSAYPGAVYLHRGEEFLVRRIDYDNLLIYVSESELPYYTQSMHDTELKILGQMETMDEGNRVVSFGSVNVKRSAIGYRKMQSDSHQVIGVENLDLPVMDFNTEAIWWTFNLETLDSILGKDVHIGSALHALEHAMIGLLPLFASCDRADIGGISTLIHPDTGVPTIFIYDGHAGGVGISKRAYQIAHDLLVATNELLSNCLCSSGCPSCVFSPKCGNNNEFIDKFGALAILNFLIQESTEIVK